MLGSLSFHFSLKEHKKLSFLELRKEHLFIPESVSFSFPKYNRSRGTSFFGVSFRPMSINLFQPKNGFGLESNIGLRVTYTYIHANHSQVPTENQQQSMHFLRPGADILIGFRLPSFSSIPIELSCGWIGHVYVPQPVWGKIETINAGKQSIWTMHQIYFKQNLIF